MSDSKNPAQIRERTRDPTSTTVKLRRSDSDEYQGIELPDLGAIRQSQRLFSERIATVPTEILDTETEFDLSRRGSDAAQLKGSPRKKKLHYRKPSFVPSELAKRFEGGDGDNSESSMVHDSSVIIPGLETQDPFLKKAQEFLRSSDKSAIFKCVCFFIFLVGGLALLIPFLLFHFGDKEHTLTGLSGSFEYIYYNLNAPTILDIQLKSNGECPEGYENMTLSNYTGTVNGCYCPGDSTVLKGACNNDDCLEIPETESQELKFWKGHNFCVKKYPEVRKTNCMEETYTDCEECTDIHYYFQCYPGGCFPNSTWCPFTKFNMTTYKMTEANFSQNFSDTQWLNGFKELLEKPIISFEVSLYGKNCFDAKSLPYSDKYYPLVPQIPAGCGSYAEDKNTFIIDNVSVYEYYGYNYMIEKLSNMTFFERSMVATRAYLVARKKILLNETKEECLDLDTTSFIASSEVLETINDLTSYSVLMGLALHFTLAFGSLAIYCFMRSGLQFRSQVFQKKGFQAYYILVSVFEVGVYIIMVLRLAKYRIDLGDFEEYFTNLTELNCFDDEQTNLAITSYTYILEDVVGTILRFAIGLAISLSIFEVFLLLGLLGTKSHPEKRTRLNLPPSAPTE